MTYVIENDIPIPPPRLRGMSQTLRELEIGQSFLIEDEGEYQCAKRMATRQPPKKFSIRKQADGWRIWRTE